MPRGGTGCLRSICATQTCGDNTVTPFFIRFHGTLHTGTLKVSCGYGTPVCVIIQHARHYDGTTIHWFTPLGMWGETNSASLHRSIAAFETCMLCQPILPRRVRHGKRVYRLFLVPESWCKIVLSEKLRIGCTKSVKLQQNLDG